MEQKVTNLGEYMYIKQYKELAKCSNFDMSLDTVYITKKDKERDIRREMIKGYMLLLNAE